ncbi:unnamed protein product [Gongylonema pulchrum]|uniref:Protein kinase domain-containing protein n=1 Tax=Gongylonema pulchrum TaxID=637853 RepID=A0A183DRZ2_9BILA|nr:unnamed protein product [Gongylonema pulchrum]
MELMGPSLEELFGYCERRFTMKTVLMLADQMIERIQCLHETGFPDNFVMGVEHSSCMVFIINMKYAFCYHSDRQPAQHVSYRENQEFHGSPYFASLNRQLGTVGSRRDDLESLLYVLLYFLRYRY